MNWEIFWRTVSQVRFSGNRVRDWNSGVHCLFKECPQKKGSRIGRKEGANQRCGLSSSFASSLTQRSPGARLAAELVTPWGKGQHIIPWFYHSLPLGSPAGWELTEVIEVGDEVSRTRAQKLPERQLLLGPLRV